MSRSGYGDDYYDEWANIRWRGAVLSAIRGKRGQAFLRELVAVLDAMPRKELITEELEAHGQFCALGAVGHARGLPLAGLNDADAEDLAPLFGISRALACELTYINDEQMLRATTAAQRWEHVRAWTIEHLSQP